MEHGAHFLILYYPNGTGFELQNLEETRGRTPAEIATARKERTRLSGTWTV